MQDGPQIRLLTGGDLELAGAAFGSISGLRARALLVALALTADDIQKRDWLADLIWPDASQDAARQNLRMALFRLRKGLPADWSERVEATQDTLCLRIERRQIDYARLLDLLQAEAADDTDLIELYRGDLLAQFPEVSPEFDRFLAERRAQVRLACIAAAASLLQRAAGLEDEQLFLRRHGFLAGIDPTNELAVEIAMEFWAARARRQLVQQVFDSFRESYRQAYDDEPPESLTQACRARLEAIADIEPPKDREAATVPLSRFPQDIGKLRSSSSFRMAATVFAGVCAVILAIIFQLAASRSVGPVFEIARAKVEMNDCAIEAVADRYQSLLTDALFDRKAGTIVVGTLQDEELARNVVVLEVRQTVQCSGEDFRGTTTIVDKVTRSVVWSSRHESLDEGFSFDDAFGHLR